MRWLVPRIGDSESAAAARLRAEGHAVVEVTVGRIVNLPVAVPPCDWLVVTSRHAVPALADLRRTGRPSPPGGALAIGPGALAIGPGGAIGPGAMAIGLRVAVVGPTTAAAVEAAGFPVAFRPSRPDGAALLAELGPLLKATDRVVRLKARNAADSLAPLADLCSYTAIDAYENVPVPLEPIDLSAYDAAYFTCSSSVERVFAVATGKTVCRAIGPATQAALDRFAHF